MSETLEEPEEFPAIKLIYMRRLQSTMHYFGFWPYKTFGQNVKALPLRYPKFLLCLWTTNIVLQIFYIKNNLHLGLNHLGFKIVATSMTCLVSQRLAVTFTEGYKQVVKKFVNEIHLIHYTDDSEYSKQMKQRVHKISTGFCYVLLCCLFSAWICTNASYIFSNYYHGMFSINPPANRSYKHIADYYLPFDYTHNLLGYVVVCIANWFLSLDCAAGLVIPDCFLSIVVFHVWGHMKILKYNLNNFPRPKMMEQTSSYQNPDRYSPEETNDVIKHLKKNIDHHRQLMHFMRETSSAFGINLAALYALHQLDLCILFYLCSRLDMASLMEFGSTTIFFIEQLIQVSMIFELISTASEDLPDAVYSVPWECMAPKERKIVLIFLINSQRNISLKAMGMVPVGVKTMASILKTSISYFLMLRTFAK